MIRPVTCICAIMAAASGLYLYQAKHRAHQLDRQIEATAHAAESARDRSGILRAEWQLLNDPERLAQLSDKFLTLKTTTPGQFTTLADLGARLPAIRPPEPPPSAAPATDDPASSDLPTAQTTPTAPTPAPVADATPKSPAKPLVASAPPRLPDRVMPKRPPIAEARLEARPETRVETRSVVMSAVAPLAAPRPISKNIEPSSAAAYGRPVPFAPAPLVGSALGMARAPLAPPVPIAAAFNPANQPGGN